MNCIVCKAELTSSDYCPKCGCKVTAQKKAAALSNLYYNQGLEKAQIRDLSGAIACLKRSLKMNKLNIQARNLLGLVYFETGEVVEALSEWVISKNMMPEGNPASGYIDRLQKNANRLDAINTSIKKYNQCLEYCRNGNADMAKMQLKKVLSSNPKLIKGYHLLALIYIHEEEYEKARKQLKTAVKIDKTNTTTLRFLKEVEEQTGRATNLESRFRIKEKEMEDKSGSMVYKSGNDYIIQPPEYREKTITSTLVNLILGLLVGAAALWFLIVPAKTQKINQEANQKVVEYSGKMAAQSAELARMKEKMDESTESVNTANAQIQEAGEKSSGYENLIKAWQAYRGGNYDNAANAIENVNADLLSVEAKSMYDTIMDQVGSTVKSKYRNQGVSALEEGDYDTAITNLLKALDIGKQDRKTMFSLAQAYEGKGDIPNANKWYQKIIDNYPGTSTASDARDYMAANGGATASDEEDTGDEGSTQGSPEGENGAGEGSQEDQTTGDQDDDENAVTGEEQ